MRQLAISIVFGLLFVLIGVYGIKLSTRSAQSQSFAAERPPIFITDSSATLALQSAVQILVISTRDGQEVAEPSLGTVVWRDGMPAILTHNHMGSVNDGSATELRITRLDRTPIATVDAATLRALTIYADAGTRLFWAPLELTDPAHGITPAAVGDAAQVQPGTMLQVVHGQATADSAVSVQALRVAAIVHRKDAIAFELHSSNGMNVRKGNSGAAVFLNGAVVGNVWATVQRVDGSATGRSIAAALPAAVGTLTATQQPQPLPLPLSDAVID